VHRSVPPPADRIDPLLDEAAALHRRGALSEAADRYARVLGGDPANATALYHLAQICCQQGRFAEGVDLVRRALAAEPQRARSHVLLGRALTELGQTDEAMACFDRAIACDGQSANAHGNRGDLLARLGRLPEAIESYRRAIAIEAGSMTNWCNLGAAQAELGQQDAALASYEQAIKLEPAFLEGHIIRGNLLAALGRNIDALASYDRALALAPAEVPVLTRRADVLVALKRPEEAMASLDRAFALAPSDVDVLSNRGFLLQSLKRYDEALAAVDRALAINPDHKAALVNRGALLSELNRDAEALAAFDRALAVSPLDGRLHCNRAETLLGLKRYKEALASADRALALDPAHVATWHTRGMLLARLSRHGEAIAAFERVLELAPSHPYALSYLATSCRAICAWDQSERNARDLFGAIMAGTMMSPPHCLIQLVAPPEVMLANARRFAEQEIGPGPTLVAMPRVSDGGRIRVGYLSGDFRAHATAYLMSGLFECHDRSRFEIIGLSCGPDDHSEVRLRIVKAFDQFHDLQGVGDREAAGLIQNLGIDILVDLAGYTEHARLGILRHRPAPIQVGYLVYPGTIGTDFLDYIITDQTVLPFDQQPFYSEKIIHVPDCYQVNDRKRVAPAGRMSRPDAGLPPQGLVFCCFNNNYKISEPVFDVWMRLLNSEPGSVLWLLSDNTGARDNLRGAAAARAVDPARLIFAERCSQSEHLARHRLADLFLDTPGCNAHTTASDALWMGLPIVTCIGSTFAGRVAASLLHAVGLSDLVTQTLDQYEALVRKLAREPVLLADVRQRLDHNRLTYPLFDTERSARHIERAYETMLEIHREGRGPQRFSVEPVGQTN
jgi:predicted O-linked N-acetylglucosamine transferase (SPINDLY family)